MTCLVSKCKICGNRLVTQNDIVCDTCADRYEELLHKQLEKTGEFNARLSQVRQLTTSSTDRGGKNAGTAQQHAEALLEPIQKMQESEQKTRQVLSESRQLIKQRRTTNIVGFFLLGFGVIVLAAAIVFASTVSAFIGLGLTLWGLLAFFIQPSKYVKSDLMNATAISSLRTVDKMMVGMGYGEKGVYIQTEDSGKAVVFIPSEPFSIIPDVSDVGDTVFLSHPKGLLVPPPGSALGALIEKKLGFKLKKCGLEILVEALPKVLVEDLEIVKDVEIEVSNDKVRFKLYDSIYADFCSEVRETSRRCGLGCPMCSALATILTIATGRPVVYDEDEHSEDGHVTEAVYLLVSGRRL